MKIAIKLTKITIKLTKIVAPAIGGIYSEDLPWLTTITANLATRRFSRLTQLALVNIEPVWDVNGSVTLQPAPEFLALDGIEIHQVHLVGFGLSIRTIRAFRNIATLVLCDLDEAVAPSIDELYAVLRETSGLEALSIKRVWNMSE
ncbi:hypothetical protein B0H14DRAFT_2630674 [Mycena olivaceomarginata]|nr:hypothetical protein B0H14DRAFT_2630674 [Mycena olivaceomarginata]